MKNDTCGSRGGWPLSAFQLSALSLLLCAFCFSAWGAPPDATKDYIDTQYTYNLGPTGARGWIYNSGNEWVFDPQGLTYESRQILITTVDAGTPASGVLTNKDVILGIGSTLFTNDARKAFGMAIGAAEAGNGQLKLKVWRGGVTNDNVTITLPVMGAYSATAPYNCPKSALILSNACNYMAGRAINGSTEGNAITCLALLAAGRTQDLAKVQAYARSIAPNYTNLNIPVNEMCAWPRGYSGTFLSEYYLVTNDPVVLPAIKELATKNAMGASWVGTYGHGMAWPRVDGTSTHGSVPPYGALNQAGLMVSIGIALGEKCGATNAVISEAIGMSRRYFGYFAGKGAVPYGESPPEEQNDDNGKSGEAALLLALQTQADMSPQVQFFAKSCTAAYSLREFGHCGPYWGKLWQPLAVNLGGTNALAAYFKQIEWELDLQRRPDGSFVTFGTVGNDGGLDNSGGTPEFMLTYALPLKKIYLTGKNASTNNWISTNDVNEAIADGKCDLIFDMKTWTTNQLIAALSSWSPQTRRYASDELASRTNVNALVPGLMTMAEGTNVYLRMGAVKTLTSIGNTNAIPVLLRRLKDPDYFVRYLATGGFHPEYAMLVQEPAKSLYTSNMLQIMIDNGVPKDPVDWNDPCQVAQYWLAIVVFNNNLVNSVAGIDTNLLYKAITNWYMGNCGWTMAANFMNTALRTNDVVALAPFLTKRIMTGDGIGYDAGPILNLLAKYYYSDGIPGGMLFDHTFCGRSSIGDPNVVALYGAAARPTLPKLYYWNTNAAALNMENVANGWLDSVINTIQNDTNPPTLRYFKKVTSASATSKNLYLPGASTTLRISGTDIAQDELAYGWKKVQGPGTVTFSANNTATSSNTVATFSMPGSYIIAGAVADSTLGDATNCYGAAFTNFAITVSDTTNAAPVAQNQSLTTPLNTAQAITLAATDANGDALTYSIVAPPGHGSLTGTASDVTYTPATSYTGPDSFTFKANDGQVDSSTATVTIDVGIAGNRRPVANNQAVSTREDTAKAITLTGSDPEANALTYAIVSLPAHGALSGTPPNVTYTPATNYPASYFNGADSFAFAVSDGSLTSAVATVSLTVTPVDDPPVANAQTVVMAEDTVQTITLTGTDPEGYPLTYAITAYPAVGTIQGASPNLTYSTPANYFGTNTLQFKVTDVGGQVSPAATVTLIVTNVNDAPVALNRSMPVLKNIPTAILLDGTDVDVGNVLTYTVLTQPAHGTLTGTAPNLIYTPATNYISTDSFTFKVNDGKVDSANIATVYLSVGSISNGLSSEFFQSPPGLNPFPDMANLLPDDTRVDADTAIEYAEFPTGYADNFSARLMGYISIPAAGSYGWVISCDDRAKVWVDEQQLVVTDPAWGATAPVHLTPGYHGIRVEFVQYGGDKYMHINGPTTSFTHWVGDSTPAAPGNLVATPGNTMVSLAWDAVGRASSYNVKRSLVSGGPYATIATNVTTARYLDTGLANGTTCYYVVSSTGPGGEGTNSTQVAVTPLASATLVTFAETALDVSTGATGLEIQNNGALVRAYHFIAHSFITDITVQGVLFKAGGEPGSFTDTAMSGAWGAGFTSWNGNWNLTSITDPAYRQFISSMLMSFSGASITIGGLTAGHTYRLQLISNNPRNGQIAVEGNSYTLSGGDNANPVLLTATWISGDTTLSMSVLNDNMHFNAYALHDLTSAAASAANSTVTANPATVANDGVATSTITVTLKDASSNPVAGKTVTLASTRGATDTISAASGLSDGSGVVSFTVKSSTAGSGVFTATDTTDSVVVAQKATVTFTPAPISTANSTVTASPTSVTANGVTTSTITVILKDGSSNPVAGKTVTLARTSGPGTPVITTVFGTTDASGVALFTVASTTAGADVFTATDATDSLVVAQTASVTFTPGAVAAGTSTVVAAPASVPANGSTTATITVTLKDAYSNPVPGKTVSLAKTSGPGTPVITTVSGTTSGSGVATFTVKSTTTGVDVFTATDTADSVVVTQTASVTFTVPSASSIIQANSSTNTSSQNSAAGGFTASATDLVNQGRSTLSSATRSHAPVFGDPAGSNYDASNSGTSVPYANDGQVGDFSTSPWGKNAELFANTTASGWVTANTLLPVTYRFTLNTSLNPGGYDITNITSTCGWLWNRDWLADQSFRVEITKDGTTWLDLGTYSYLPVTSTVQTSTFETQVVLSNTGGGALNNGTYVAQHVTGIRITYLSTGLTSGSDLDGTAIKGIDVLGQASPALTANAANSTAVASPTTVASDGVTTSTVTVTLKDASSNSVAGKTVTLTSSRGGTDTISAASGPSSASGVVTFTVKSSTAGSPVFTATDTTDSVVVAQTATVTFSTTATSAANSTVQASPTSVTANGVTTSTITVTLKDAGGTPVPGKTVTLASSRGAVDTISAASGPSAANGVVAFTVKSMTPGSPVFTAADTTDSLVVAQTATVTFTVGPVSATSSTVTASPTSVPADGISTSTITVILKDGSSNPVAGKAVTLASSRGANDTISAASGASSSSGVVTFTVRSSTPGSAVFTGTDTTDSNLVLAKTATVVFAGSSAKDILTCNFGALGAATISGTNITLTVPVNQALTNLAPTFTISALATLSPASGSTNDFTTARTYTVTAQDGSTRAYAVTVQSYQAWACSGSLFILTTTNGAYLPASASETNFPLLVRLNTNNFNFSQAQTNGADVRFAATNGTPLAYQIEQWDRASGTASLWVRIPAIKGNTNQEIKMYWGNSNVVSQSSGSNVFNAGNGFVSVFHLNETIQDEVGTLSPVNAGSILAAGIIGKCRNLVAGSGINCGDSITNYPFSNYPFTSEAWFRADAINSTIVGFGRYPVRYNGSSDGDEVNINYGSPSTLYWESDGGGGAYAATPVSLGQWHHVAATYANNTSQIFVDGKLDGTGSGAMSLFTNIQMTIGGMRGGCNFDGDIDEVRVSSVARSTNWIGLEYENQKAMQTLVGPVVQPGSNFSVTPASITMSEGSTTNLTAQAGGAQKIYWIQKKDGQETVLAVDQFTLSFAAGRVSGNQSFVLQFRAVYPTEVKTNDISVTVLDTIPAPVFTLLPSTNLWDGRTVMTVKTNISNWSALLAAGVTNLTYNWTVAGVAVTKTITPGRLTLTRSQGSGPMTVTLALENGEPMTHSIVVTVQEPTNEAWVVRTPDATEKAMNNQFYARDNTGYGTLYYNGTLAGTPNSVFLKVYTNGPGGDVLYTNISQALVGGAYAFTARVASGLVTYKVQFGSVTGSNTNILDTVTNIVCGDAYLIDGQSNADATSLGPEANSYSNSWIRTGTWVTATRAGSDHIGYWGMDLASNLWATYQLPIYIVNAGRSGTRIDEHLTTPHSDSYGAVAAARLTHGIRGVFWHQGESDAGTSVDGYLWQPYQQKFLDMSAVWKEDYPNIQHYYLFQIFPNSCGEGGGGDMLREVQRTLPYLYSNMRIMSSVGFTGNDGCHYSAAGYSDFARFMLPLVKQDNYGLVPSTAITAPDLKKASYTTTNRTEIALEFGQDMAWANSATSLLYLDGVSGKVASGSVSGKVIRLQLTGYATNRTITYLCGVCWNRDRANLIYGSNGVAALTFAAVPIAPPAAVPPPVAPAITSLAPVSGRTNGGTVVTLTGSNFLSGATVQFGGLSATAVSLNSSTQVTATTPAHGPGLVSVVVSNTNGLSATNQFTYVLPPPVPVLPVSGVRVTNGVPSFSFTAAAGCLYRLGYKNALTDAVWTPGAWTTNSTGNPLPMTLIDSSASGQPQRFYRFEAASP